MNRKLSEKGTLELLNEREKTETAIKKSTSKYLKTDLSKHLREIDRELKRRRAVHQS